MPKKKQQRNGLYWFMQDLLPQLRREGRVFPNGMADVVPIALPRWQELSAIDREAYERRAKEEKKRQRNVVENDKYRLDNVGNVVADRVDKKEELEKKRLKEGRISRSRWPMGEEFLDFKFYFISFEYFWATEDGMSLPVEVGLIELSFKHGITKHFHKFIKPRTLDGRDIPLGFRFKCKQHSEERHQIPITDFELAEDNYRGILIQIENFVNPNGEKHEYPPLYALEDEVENAAYALDWLHAQAAPGHGPRLTKVFELENMVLDLYFRIPKQISHSGVKELFTNTNFDYEPNVRCTWHENEDARFCALGTVRKAGFHLLDALADPYDFDLTSQHLPLKSEEIQAIITMSRPTYNDPAPMGRAARNDSNSTRARSTGSAYTTFASRDIRYQDDYDDDSDDTENSDFPELEADMSQTLRRPTLPPTTVWAAAALHESAKMVEIPERKTLSQAVAGKTEPTASQKPTLGQAVAQKQTLGQAVAQKPTLGQAVVQKQTLGQAVAQKPTLGQAVAQKQTLGQAVAQKPTLSQAVAQKQTLGQAVAQKPTLGQAVAQKQTLGQAVAHKQPSQQAAASFKGAGRGFGRGFVTEQTPATRPETYLPPGVSSAGEGISIGRGASSVPSVGRGTGRGIGRGRGLGRGSQDGAGRSVGRGFGRGAISTPRAVNAPGMAPTVEVPSRSPSTDEGASMYSNPVLPPSSVSVNTSKSSASFNAPQSSASFNAPQTSTSFNAPQSSSSFNAPQTTASSNPPSTRYQSNCLDTTNEDSGERPPSAATKSVRQPSTMPKALSMGWLGGRGAPIVNTSTPQVNGQPGGVGRGMAATNTLTDTPMLGRGRGVYRAPERTNKPAAAPRPPPGFGRGMSVQMSSMSLDDNEYPALR